MERVYRGHTIVEVSGMDIVNHTLEPAQRFLVAEHHTGIEDHPVRGRSYLDERNAEREINQCLKPEPPRAR